MMRDQVHAEGVASGMVQARDNGSAVHARDLGLARPQDEGQEA
jgi:hypothetical protein